MSNARVQFNNIQDKVSQNPFISRQGLVYARVSSKRQELEGSGLQSQEGRCINDLKYIGVPHLKTFFDSYSGGGDFMNRPAMREMLAYIDDNPHKKFVVIFDDLKRFARDTEFHFKLRTTFRVRNVHLRCLNYNFDDSPEGIFTETIFAAQGQLEREQNRRQVIQKQKARLELGYWPFGSKKGYTQVKDPAHGKICVPDKMGLEVLKPALEGFANGTFVHKIDICNFLVERGFWTKQSPARYIDRITSILKDSFYAGYIEYPAWEVSKIPGKHKAIISLETYQIIQKRLNKNYITRVRKDFTGDFPLRGLLICGDCKTGHISGGWSTGRTKKYAYYFCQNRNCPSFQGSISAKTVHLQFREILKQSGMKKSDLALTVETFDRVWKEEIENVSRLQSTSKNREDTLKKKLDEITTLLISTRSEAVKRALERQIETVSEEIETAEREIIMDEKTDMNIPYRTALNKVVGLLKSPYSIWENCNVQEQHNLFYFIFEHKVFVSKIEGCRTAEKASFASLFEDFACQNSHDVDMSGKTLNRIKDYLFRFWAFYNSSPMLQQILEKT